MNFDNFHCLGEISTEDFLTQYWQKKPLLIRHAFSDLPALLSAEELAGLACEDHVNARLVLEKDGMQPWQLEFGPFEESRFSELPESHWSLLVSDVEKHCPEAKSLLKSFRFIPDWRIDDLMISYAPHGGSVGAHVDAYDVFLIQLSGQRRWKISEHFSTEILDDIDLRILKNFTAEQEWLLDAGDMLYLPPNIAHHGIAQICRDTRGNEQPCLTASVGFRAPSLKAASNEFIHFINETSVAEKHYRDISPVTPAHHAEINEDTVTHFMDFLKQGLTLEREQVRQWLGEYCSDNKSFEDCSEYANEHQTQNDVDFDYDKLCGLASKSKLKQSPYSHFLFSHSQQSTLLFVNGIAYTVSKQFAESICEDADINFKKLQQNMNPDDKKVLLTLFNVGAITTT